MKEVCGLSHSLGESKGEENEMTKAKQNLLIEIVAEILSIKYFIKYTPNAVDDIYYHLGRMRAYTDAYRKFFNEQIPEPTLTEIAEASKAVRNWRYSK